MWPRMEQAKISAFASVFLKISHEGHHGRRGAAKRGGILVFELGMGSHGAQPVQMTVICHLYRSEVLQPGPHAAVLPIKPHHHMPYTRRHTHTHCPTAQTGVSVLSAQIATWCISLQQC